MNISRWRLLIPIVIVVLAGVGLYGLLPQLGNFHASIQAIQGASIPYVLLAIAAVCLSYVLSALTYYLLALKPLRYTSTLLVELAGLLVNRVLPAGIGGLGLNYAYLRTHKHSVVAASSVVALNNVLGFIGHALLAVCLLTSAPHTLKTIHIGHNAHVTALSLGLVIVLGAAFVIFRARLRAGLVRLRHQLLMISKTYSQRPLKLAAALLASGCLTLANVSCLWLCCKSLGLTVSFVTVFVVFTFGVAAGTVAPTPGGVGAVEAGLVAGLVAFGVPAADALAAALVYRLVSFWLGLIIGSVAFYVVRAQRLANF